MVSGIHRETTLWRNTGISTVEVTNGTPNILKVVQYASWFQHIRNKFSEILIYTTSEGVCFLNQVKGKVPGKVIIDLKKQLKPCFLLSMLH